MQPHANVFTASGGDSGDSSWDHDDGGSRGVTWAGQKTGSMPSGGSDCVGATPTHLGVCGDGYGDNGTENGDWIEESDP